MEVKMESIAKASLVAVFLGFGVTAVAAQPPLSQPADMQVRSDNILLAGYSSYQYKKKNHHYTSKKKWVYSEKYGHRYRHKRHGYNYYYEGWWYPRPYWEPGVNIHLGL
jgi:hypothetical protein